MLHVQVQSKGVNRDWEVNYANGDFNLIPHSEPEVKSDKILESKEPSQKKFSEGDTHEHVVMSHDKVESHLKGTEQVAEPKAVDAQAYELSNPAVHDVPPPVIHQTDGHHAIEKLKESSNKHIPVEHHGSDNSHK